MTSYETWMAASITDCPRLLLRTRSKRLAIAEARRAVSGLQLRGGGGVWVNRLTHPADWDPLTIWAWGEGMKGGFGYRLQSGSTYVPIRRPRPSTKEE